MPGGRRLTRHPSQRTFAEYAKRDSRIHTVSLEKNKAISGATNAAMGLCTGEYLAFLDHDDELAPFALSEVVQTINQKPDVDMFYSDEDKIDEQGRRYDVFFNRIGRPICSVRAIMSVTLW